MRKRKSNPRKKRSAKARRGARPATGRVVRPDSSAARAFTVLARCRRTGESPESVSRQMGTYFAVVRRHLRGQFHKVRGKWVPTKSDRLPRRKQLLTEQGYITITVRGSKKAAELNQYNQVIDRFIHGKDHDPSALESFDGKSILGHRFLTDPEKVFRLADAGLIRTEELGSDQVARGGKK